MATYAILYWGRPRRMIRTSATADGAISSAKSAIATGSCIIAKVYECETAVLAKTADISRVRDGERAIYG